MSAGRGYGEVLTGSASWPAGWPPPASRRKGAGVVMVSEELARRWEAVYREYGLASEMVNKSEPGDRAIARRMARSSEDVAAVWRLMVKEPDLPWWAVAALVAAAQAFEYQARDWAARAKYDRESAPRKGPYPVAVDLAGRHTRSGGVADVV